MCRIKKKSAVIIKHPVKLADTFSDFTVKFVKKTVTSDDDVMYQNLSASVR